VTILDTMGRPEVADVKARDLWYFPAGLPHSLQGLDPDGCEFVIAFDNGRLSEILGKDLRWRVRNPIAHQQRIKFGGFSQLGANEARAPRLVRGAC
jgi:hypothetical protein